MYNSLKIAYFDTVDCGTDLLLALNRKQFGEDEKDTVSKGPQTGGKCTAQGSSQTDLGGKRHLDICSPTLCSQQHQVAQGPVQTISQHSQ